MPSGAVHVSARDDTDVWVLGFVLGWSKNNEGSCRDLDSSSQDTGVILYSTQWAPGTNDAFSPKEKKMDLEM